MYTKSDFKKRFPKVSGEIAYYRRHIKYYIWRIFHIYVFLLVVFLYPIYRIRKQRIGYLRTNIIGHLALHTKTFFELVENREYFLDIKKIKLIRERVSSNEYLLNKLLEVKPNKINFKKSSRFLEPHGRRSFDALIDKYKFASKVIIDVERTVMQVKVRKIDAHHQNFDESKVLNLAYSGLVFPRGNYSTSNFLNENGLNPKNPTVGVIDRDPAFSIASPLRDTKIEDLNELCRHLRRVGYQVVRLGSVREYRVDSSIDGVLDYPFLINKSAELEIELCRQLDFYIGWNTGFSLVPTVFRKPLYIISSPFFPMLTANTINNPSMMTVGVDGNSMNLIDLIYRTGEWEFEKPEIIANYKLSIEAIDFENVISDIHFFVNKRTLSKEMVIAEKEYGVDLAKAIGWVMEQQSTSSRDYKLEATKYISDLLKARNYVSPSFLKKYSDLDRTPFVSPLS